MFFTSFCISRSTLSAREAFESLFGWSPLRFSSVVKWFGGRQWWKDDDWKWESGCISIYIHIFIIYVCVNIVVCQTPETVSKSSIPFHEVTPNINLYKLHWIFQFLGRTIPPKIKHSIFIPPLGPSRGKTHAKTLVGATSMTCVGG